MNAHLRTIKDLAKISASWIVQPVIFVLLALEFFGLITADVPILPSVILTLLLSAALTAITTLVQVAVMAAVKGVHDSYTTKLAINKRDTQ